MAISIIDAPVTVISSSMLRERNLFPILLCPFVNVSLCEVSLSIISLGIAHLRSSAQFFETAQINTAITRMYIKAI